MTLVEFLLARIAEDESKIEGDWTEGYGLHIISTEMYERMRAEVEAKRQIVESSRWIEQHPDWFSDADLAGEWKQAETCLTALAAIYASHADYRSEWRP